MKKKNTWSLIKHFQHSIVKRQIVPIVHAEKYLSSISYANKRDDYTTLRYGTENEN